jgi:pimeloyl-ACP methyl ester carboxylesterase
MRWILFSKGNKEPARFVPNAEQVIIPKAGHGSPRKNPPAFNEVVEKFLNHQRC